jgi:hypothetical protein
MSVMCDRFIVVERMKMYQLKVVYNDGTASTIDASRDDRESLVRLAQKWLDAGAIISWAFYRQNV